MGVGTWQWGDRATWGYGQGYDESDVRAAFEAALDTGVSFFDTAEIYGRGESERVLGRCLRGRKDQVQVATKFFPFPWRLFKRGSLLDALKASLRRLQLERVALYQIHWPLPLVPGDVWAAELAEAIEEGLTERVGVSNYGPHNVRRMHRALARRGIELASNQVEYSLLRRRVERNGVLTTCRELGVQVIAYSPLAMGLLGGRYSTAHPPPTMRRLRAGRRLRRATQVVPTLREIGAAHGDRTPAQVALNWLIYHGAVPIPGAKSEQQVRANAGALGWQLTADEIARLDRLAPR
jgi:aryl-alcohol dehydrogenase-like predicted oxidoreductase